MFQSAQIPDGDENPIHKSYQKPFADQKPFDSESKKLDLPSYPAKSGDARTAYCHGKGLEVKNNKNTFGDTVDRRTHWVYYVVEVIIVDIREMRKRLGDTQSEFAARYNIPFRTIQNWESGTRKPPEYIISLLEYCVEEDLINRKTVALPKYDPKKQDLPRRSDFIGTTAWLKAVQDCIGEPVVFALDEALMCQGSFEGRMDEYLVWVYGSDAVTRFNGVIVLGNQISAYDVEKRNGLEYTNFNRTLSDALVNESILDMQGITEAVSRYYISNGDSFSGIFVSPEYQMRFEKLANDAIDYYEN